MRGKGEGSVSRSPDGAGWIARIDLPRVDGKRQRRKRRAKTRAEALRLLGEMRRELEATGSNTDKRRTVDDAIDAYMVVRQNDELSEGAIEDTEWAAKIISRDLGSVRLVDLSVVDCDRFLSNCAKPPDSRRPIGRDRINRIRRCLIRVLWNEMRTGRLTRNVAELSIAPKAGDQPERRALTKEELDLLLGAATDSRLIIVDLCGRNGLRPAEARSLRWADVDLDAFELSVHGQQNRHNERAEVKKAHNAARTIRLGSSTVNRLKEWAEVQDVMRSKAGSVWHDLDIIASTNVGTPIDRHSLARSVRSLCRSVGIDPPIRPYELRHTAISHQADAGRSAWEIADWAGTSEAMISRVYRKRLRRVAGLSPLE